MVFFYNGLRRRYFLTALTVGSDCSLFPLQWQDGTKEHYVTQQRSAATPPQPLQYSLLSVSQSDMERYETENYFF